MERSIFRQRIALATQRAIEVGRTFVEQPLLGSPRYLLFANQSVDADLWPDEFVYQSDQLAPGAYRGPWTHEQVLGFLWRESRVPEWVDILVVAEPHGHTLLELSCCSRFTDNDSRLYTIYGDTTPFHVLSPPLPPGWQEGQRFNLDLKSYLRSVRARDALSAD